MLGIALRMMFIMNMIVKVHITQVFIQNKTNADYAEGGLLIPLQVPFRKKY